MMKIIFREFSVGLLSSACLSTFLRRMSQSASSTQKNLRLPRCILQFDVVGLIIITETSWTVIVSGAADNVAVVADGKSNTRFSPFHKANDHDYWYCTLKIVYSINLSILFKKICILERVIQILGGFQFKQVGSRVSSPLVIYFKLLRSEKGIVSLGEIFFLISYVLLQH